MNNILPEQIELEKKLRVLDRLKDRLADREEEIVDLSSELEQFEAQYTMQVGRLYAEQDEVDALIAEEELKLVPATPLPELWRPKNTRPGNGFLRLRRKRHITILPALSIRTLLWMPMKRTVVTD